MNKQTKQTKPPLAILFPPLLFFVCFVCFVCLFIYNILWEYKKYLYRDTSTYYINSIFVFVLNKDSDTGYRVEKRMISIGELLPQGFEIISGLNENELIATAGLNSLMDGMIVRLLEN